MTLEACSACEEPLGGGRFCPSCGAPASEISPFASPREDGGAPVSPTAGPILHDIAKYQRFIIWILLASTFGVGVPTLIAGFLGAEVLAQVATGVVALAWGLGLVRAVLLYRLAVAAQVSVGWAVFGALCGLHNIAGLIALVVVNAKATKHLKRAGVRVGLLGVSAGDLRKLASS